MADPIKPVFREDGSAYLELPDEILRELGVGAGDTVHVSLTEHGLHITSEPLAPAEGDKEGGEGA